jgi:hypothetical protein
MGVRRHDAAAVVKWLAFVHSGLCTACCSRLLLLAALSNTPTEYSAAGVGGSAL